MADQHSMHRPNNRPLRVACIGAGYFAAFHHRAWAEHPDVELVAIADLDLDKAQHAVTEAGKGQAVTTLSEALALGPIDLCDIAAPPPAHLGLIDEASAAGCAIICQKPFCGNIADARKATDLAQARGVPLVIHENFRFQPWWRKIHEQLQAGQIGDLYEISFRLRPGDGQGPRAYLDRQPYFQGMERFLIHETAVHLIDVFRFLMGEPAWVWADLRRINPVIAGEDAGIVVLGFSDGRRAVFDGNRLSDHTAENRRLVMGEGVVEGSSAVLHLTGDGAVSLREFGDNTARAIEVAIKFDEFGGGCVAALQDHVVRALRGGGVLENEAGIYLKNLSIVEAIYKSAQSGSRVELEPVEIPECVPNA